MAARGMLAVLFCSIFAGTLAANEAVRARVYIFKAVKGGTPSQIIGTVDFQQHGSSLTLNGTVNGLAGGLHGFHIHEFGDFGDGCMATGAHYNPFKMSHGAPTDSNRHVGDLGNIRAPDSGPTTISISDTVASLTGQYSILGRSVVIHEKADDLGRGTSELSKTTGDAGARIACGVIGLLEEEYTYTTVPTLHDNEPVTSAPLPQNTSHNSYTVLSYSILFLVCIVTIHFTMNNHNNNNIL